MLSFSGREVEDLAVGASIEVDANSGAAALRVPVLPPPGRSNLAPPLVLVYGSSAGNSAFGLGWSLVGLPSISLDTARHVARWDGSDRYAFGGDELVPWLARQGANWAGRGFDRGDWSVAYLRSRRGGTRTRIEKWLHRPSGRVHFRTRDADNLLTLYGARPNAAGRIADPDDETRTLTWLPELMIDPHGNALWIDYLAETADGIDRSAPNEPRRLPLAQRYLKRIRYGNTAPLALDDAVLAGTSPDGLRWRFQLVLDYGDHDPAVVRALPDRPWPTRLDPFSVHRHGFEVRTWRLCRRFLSFHDFPELGAEPTPVAALALTHAPDPAGTTVTDVARVGYRREAGGIVSKTIPPLRLTYAPPATETAFAELPATALANVPAGLAQRRTAFVDLLGEGLSGILAETDRAWFYKPNLGGGQFGAQALVRERPMSRSGVAGLGDMDGDGDTDLSVVSGRFAGLFARDREHDAWENFRPFPSFPHVEALGDRARWIDLNGDGRPDLVISRGDRFVWFASEGEAFAPPVEVPRPDGPEAVPTLNADATLDFFFTDMNGDGLADFVRIRNRCVEYWPALGNGRFGDRVVMADAPSFDDDDAFDPQRLRFVDLDGSGTSDLVYLGRGEVSCWINGAGNRLLPGPRLTGLPNFDSLANVRVFDFLGDGRACLVWSTPLPGRETPLQYLPLTPQLQPRLLVAVADRLGRETRFTYSSSASHYLRDVAAGRGWNTRLPSHRMVVDRQEEIDLIAKTSRVWRYAYHDGYYDGEERISRGFGQVDISDSDVFTGPDLPPETFAAPSLTRVWFHLGTPMWDRHRPSDTYAADPELPWLGPHVVEDEDNLSPEEINDGLRALAGHVIRREVFALDAHGVRAAHPICVQQERHRLRRVQPAAGATPPAFFAIRLEQASWTYEQTPGDPRVAHEMVLALDAYDQPLRQATVGYARRAGRARDVAAQDRHWLHLADAQMVNFDEPDRYELALTGENRALELVGLRPGANGLFTREQLNAPAVAAAVAAPMPHEAEPADDPGLGPRARLLQWERKFYWNAARDAALPLGQIGPVALLHHEESACFSPAFVAATLGNRVDDAALTALGYVNKDGLWWQIGMVHSFAPAAQFSLRTALRRSDGAESRFAYDPHSLLIVSVTDPLGNVTTAVNDYHRLAPWRITDANGSIEEVRYDPLGVIIVNTRIGQIRDQRWGFDALDAVAARTPANLDAAIADPKNLIQGAAGYTWYDLEAFARDGSPTVTLDLEREDLLDDGAGGGADERVAVSVGYIDGFGRSLQMKALAEPGPAIQRDAGGRIVLDAGGRPVMAPADPRWRVAGNLVYDTRQRPIRSYEPFFTTSAAFEGDDVLRQFGSATLISYDAASRVSARHFPNGTFSTVTTGAWQIEEADPNDTVLDSAWRALREPLPADAAERQALEEARPHAGTTKLVFLDPLGRAAATLAKGGATAPDRRIEMRADIAGRTTEMVDPRGLTAFRYRRDMRGHLIQQDSVDAGTSFALTDAFDRDIMHWDARGFIIRRGYDVSDRPTLVEVKGGDGPAPLDHRVEEYVYGESLADRDDARRRNLFGRLLTARDGACESTIDHYDPGGHALASTRRLRTQTDTEPDWRAAVPLDPDVIATAASFDAVGRIRADTLADGSTRSYEYLSGETLARVRLTTPDGRLAAVPVLDGTTCGARGELTAMTLGNGVQLAYAYDPDAQRLTTQTATRGARVLQQIDYSYDPVGNIVRITDAAQEGVNAVIAGIAVPARRDYLYDAHYRLLRATGRVHQALLQWDSIPGAANTIKGTRRISFNDGAAVERFTRSYDYDAGGNLQRMRHVGTTRNWTTDFWISPTSNRSLPALDPGGNPIAGAEAKFDPAGNLRELPHLRQMQWNWAGALARAVVIARPGDTDDAERYRYGADGRRVVKQTTRLIQAGLVEVTEKVYFGDAERKRIRRNGQLVLERWTLHVGDGKQRIALVHRWTRDDLAREVDDIAQPRLRYQLASHQRSAVMELDEQGSLISYEEYFAHGDTAFVVGDDLREVERRDYRYSGRECDDFTGFYYYGFRYFAPWLARWISPDPIGPADDLNLYQFVLGNPVCNSDADGLQTEALHQFGSVSSKAKTGAAAMREFNNAHALEVGFLVTKVERLKSGDWLIKEARPLPPGLRETAEKLHGDLELAQTFEDLKNSLAAANLGPGEAGLEHAPTAGSDAKPGDGGDGGPGATQSRGGNTPDLADGNGGTGTKGTGKDAGGHDGGPAQEGEDIPVDQSTKEGKAGGAGVGTGKGSDIGAGTGTDPTALPGARGKGTGEGAPKGAPPGSGGSGGKGAKSGDGGKKGGDPNGIKGGLGSGPATGNNTQPFTNGASTGNGGENGGLTDPKLTPSATGQPPIPGVTKQGADPKGVLDGGTADTAQPDAPGTPSQGRGSANGREGGTGDSTNGINNPGGGPGGKPGGSNDGTPDGAGKGMPGGGGTHELPWYLAPLRYVGKALQIAGAVLEIGAGLAMLIVPEPTITKVGGVMLVLHGLDSLQAAIRGDRTFTAKGATWVAKQAGASDMDAQLIGDLVDIAVPLIAGGLGAAGRLGANAGLRGFTPTPGWKIPGTGGYARWLMQGAANDAALRALKAKSPVRAGLAELGQRTLTPRAWAAMGESMGAQAREAQTVNAMIQRGIWLTRAQKVAPPFMYRFSPLAVLVTRGEKGLRWSTIATGPSSALRAWGSAVFPAMAGVMNFISKGLFFQTTEDYRTY